MLVEVLVASTILLLVFTAVVQQVGNLAEARIQIETRDRAVAYVNSLHEMMAASGCGLDVDTVTEETSSESASSDSYSGSDQVSLRGPWDRVQACALSALERSREDVNGRVNSYVDQNGTVHLSVDDNGEVSSRPIDKVTAKKFCDEYGDDDGKYTSHVCELGDQSFTHRMIINDDGITASFDVTVDYWFEKIGATDGIVTPPLNKKSSCNQIVASAKMPDTLARRISITFPNGHGGTESMTVTKRESVPVDSFQFASGTRVGVISAVGEQVTMYPNPDSVNPWKVTRTRDSASGCIWFPYLLAHQATDIQPTFSVDNAGASQSALSEIPALHTGNL